MSPVVPADASASPKVRSRMATKVARKVARITSQMRSVWRLMASRVKAAASVVGMRGGAPAPPPGGGDPGTGRAPRLFQPVQRRIDRAFGQIEGLAAALLDCLDDRIAMRRPRLQRGENDRVEVPLEHFRFH